MGEKQESGVLGFLPAGAAGRWTSRRSRGAQASGSLRRRGARSGSVVTDAAMTGAQRGGPAPAPTPGVRSPP